MKDALRHEVKDVVERAKLAGAKIVMITGDYKLTAQAIAKEAGIWVKGDGVITGDEIEKMTKGEFSHKFAKVSVFAHSPASDPYPGSGSVSLSRHAHSPDLFLDPGTHLFRICHQSK